MQKWISQQRRLFNRQAGVREKDSIDQVAARKAAYLAKLGLGDKAKAVKETTGRPWHLNHIVEGDIFKGTFSHPSITQYEKVDLTLTATSSTGGTWSSNKMGFEGDVEIEQDFPIVFEKGEARDLAMATYIFNKFNAGWRDFAAPMPSAEQMEHLTLRGLRMFFGFVAGVEGFPSESDFNENAANPEKGMTIAEFLKYIKNEDPDYLDGVFGGIYTGRRVKFGDEDLLLDGDFQADADGMIFGYAYVNGKGGGAFQLELVKKAS